MLLSILIILAVVTLATIVALVARQLWLLRQGRLSLSTPREEDLGELLQRQIDRWYHGFGLFFKQLVHYLYFYFLLALRRLVIIVRYLLVRVERKFSRLIDSVRGKGVIHKKGAVSFFLAQIREPNK